MPRSRPDRKRLRAHREYGVSRHETVLKYILEEAKPPVYHAFVEWNREPEHYWPWPGISPDTGPVTIYGPDGTVRERVSAQAFRRRHPPRFRTVRR